MHLKGLFLNLKLHFKIPNPTGTLEYFEKIAIHNVICKKHLIWYLKITFVNTNGELLHKYFLLNFSVVLATLLFIF